jgi:Protein of unknown function (DUF1499)
MNAHVQSLLAHPQRALEIAIVVAVAIVFVALFMRPAVRVLFKITILVGILAIIAGGVAILMNGVSLAGPPGPAARLRRFLTVDWAATSATGNGAAGCADAHQLAAAALPHKVGRLRHAAEHTSAPATPAAGTGTQTSVGNDYPELVRRSYPGIPPRRLFQIAANTASGMPGWQIATADPKTMTIDAFYTTRVLGFRDDVRIVVTPDDGVDVCSRSRVGEPDARSLMGFFHGDFGANISHIKEFYAALTPPTDAAYRHEELKQAAKEHGVHF